MIEPSLIIEKKNYWKKNHRFVRQCISFPQWSNFNCNLYTRPIRPYSRGRINDRIVNWKVTGTLIKYRSSGGDVSHTSPPVCIWANRIIVSPKKFFPLSSTSTFLHLIFFFIPSTSKVFLNYLPQIYDYMTFLSPKGFFFLNHLLCPHCLVELGEHFVKDLQVKQKKFLCKKTLSWKFSQENF